MRQVKFLGVGLFVGALLVQPALLQASKSRGLEYSDKPHRRVYKAKLHEVWRAVQKVMSDYPLEVNSVDQALLETQDLDYRKHWPAFYNPKKSQQGNYRLKVQVLKAPASTRVEQSPIMQVWIHKTVFKKTDFFSGDQNLLSDGMEEAALFYRIGREMYLHKLTTPKL